MKTASLFQIESNIPVPSGAGRRCKYPWGEMKVGDSFFVPGIDTSKLCRAAGSFIKYRKSEMKVTVRKEGNGARVWRIA